MPRFPPPPPPHPSIWCLLMQCDGCFGVLITTRKKPTPHQLEKQVYSKRVPCVCQDWPAPQQPGHQIHVHTPLLHFQEPGIGTMHRHRLSIGSKHGVLWLGRDLNLPDIKWASGTITGKNNPRVVSQASLDKCCNKCCNEMNEAFFDLFLTNWPSLVTRYLGSAAMTLHYQTAHSDLPEKSPWGLPMPGPEPSRTNWNLMSKASQGSRLRRIPQVCQLKRRSHIRRALPDAKKPTVQKYSALLDSSSPKWTSKIKRFSRPARKIEPDKKRSPLRTKRLATFETAPKRHKIGMQTGYLSMLQILWWTRCSHWEQKSRCSKVFIKIKNNKRKWISNGFRWGFVVEYL